MIGVIIIIIINELWVSCSCVNYSMRWKEPAGTWRMGLVSYFVSELM